MGANQGQREAHRMPRLSGSKEYRTLGTSIPCVSVSYSTIASPRFRFAIDRRQLKHAPKKGASRAYRYSVIVVFVLQYKDE